MTSLPSSSVQDRPVLKLQEEAALYDLEPFSSVYLLDHLELAVFPEMENLISFLKESLTGLPPPWASTEMRWNTVRKEIREALSHTSENLQMSIMLLRKLVRGFEDLKQHRTGADKHGTSSIEDPPHPAPLKLPDRVGELSRAEFANLKAYLVEIPLLCAQMIERIEADFIFGKTSGTLIAGHTERVFTQLTTLKESCDIACGNVQESLKLLPSKLVASGKVPLRSSKQEAIPSSPPERRNPSRPDAVSKVRAASTSEAKRPVKLPPAAPPRLRATKAATALQNKPVSQVSRSSKKPAPVIYAAAPRDALRVLEDSQWRCIQENKEGLSQIRRDLTGGGMSGDSIPSPAMLKKIEQIHSGVLKVSASDPAKRSQLTVVGMELEIIRMELENRGIAKCQLDQLEKVVKELSFLA